MPYDISVGTLPCGVRYVRAVGTGDIGKPDADHLLTFVGKGGTMFGVPMLFLSQAVSSISPEARGMFNGSWGSPEEQAWCAVVMANALVRVTTNFLSRVNGYRRMKMFGTEEAAVRWLDERVRERDEAARQVGSH